MASKTALMRREVAIARASANASNARMRARMEGRIADLRARVRDAKMSSRTQMTIGTGLAAVGAIGGGQVARMQLFPDAEGNSRAPLVNLGIGVVSLAALSSGWVRSREAQALAAVGVGMAIGQLAITSYTRWDLVPGDWFGA